MDDEKIPINILAAYQDGCYDSLQHLLFQIHAHCKNVDQVIALIEATLNQIELSSGRNMSWLQKAN